MNKIIIETDPKNIYKLTIALKCVLTSAAIQEGKNTWETDLLEGTFICFRLNENTHKNIKK